MQLQNEVVRETCVDLWREMRSVSSLAHDFFDTLFVETVFASVSSRKGKTSKEVLASAYAEMQKARGRLGPAVRHSQPVQVKGSGLSPAGPVHAADIDVEELSAGSIRCNAEYACCASVWHDTRGRLVPSELPVFMAEYIAMEAALFDAAQRDALQIPVPKHISSGTGLVNLVSRTQREDAFMLSNRQVRAQT